MRLISWYRSPIAKVAALSFLAAVVLVRLALATYWSWDSPERFRLLIIWGLGLIALLMIARFTWHTLSPRLGPGTAEGTEIGNARSENRE